jgi:2-phospho-L-lactate/phosphoenolpyruvate guanylyltransferase
VIFAIVPAKDPKDAKARLSPLLEPEQRESLFLAMLGDVLAAVCTTSGLDGVFVVARQPELVRLARQFGADVCVEPGNFGHTQAVQLGVEYAVARGAKAMMTIPGDVPAVTPLELETMIAASESRGSAVFVPSRSGLGTNGVLLTPPDAMPLRFGEPSFPNHLETAERFGLHVRVVELPGLGLDIDTPDDLALLLSHPAGPRTRGVLDELSMHGAFARLSSPSVLAANVDHAR